MFLYNLFPQYSVFILFHILSTGHVVVLEDQVEADQDLWVK